MYTRSECSYKPWTSGDNAVVNVGSVTNESPWGEMLRAGEALRCGGRDLWEISLPLSQFCCESKTSLKNKFYLKRIFLRVK